MELNVDGSWDTEWMYICSLRSMDISLQFLPGPSDGADRHERTRSCVKHGQDGVFGMECQHATPKLVVVTTIAFEGGGGHCTKTGTHTRGGRRCEGYGSLRTITVGIRTISWRVDPRAGRKGQDPKCRLDEQKEGCYALSRARLLAVASALTVAGQVVTFARLLACLLE